MTARRQHDPLLGMRLGDYVLQELLGRGGMARVYRGLDENLGRLAAVKVLDTTAAEMQDERIVARFKLEARAIANFEHPNIVSVYQYGETDALFFIAMKLVRGHTLSRVLRDHKRSGQPMPPKRVLEIVRDVCAALDYAHERGIIHRDVKPSNILFDEAANNRAILTDFGLAMELGGDTTLGTAFGTPRYIAPEQAMSSQQAVPQSDIYSLAVVVYEMLTGKVPFEDESPMSIALSHITSEPPPPRSINPAIPAEVERVILRALAKEPADRYATAGEFYHALEEAYIRAEVDMPTLSIPPEPDTLYLVEDETTARLQDGLTASGQAEASPAIPADAAEITPPLEDARAVPVKAKFRRRRPGCVARLVMLVIVVGGLVGFWWFNGQSLALPPAVTDAIWWVAQAIVPDRAGDVLAIPQDAELTLELLYDNDRFALRNPTEYTVPLDGLIIEWTAGGPRVTLSGADLHGPLPPGQCAWFRLLEKGTLQPPAGCPTTAHFLKLLNAPADLFWAGRETFTVRFRGRELAVCALADGRCAFTLPH
ncbi:MAG: hypothetical protein Kow0077_21060 [Anaerolineae bacterium]